MNVCEVIAKPQNSNLPRQHTSLVEKKSHINSEGTTAKGEDASHPNVSRMHHSNINHCLHFAMQHIVI